MATGAKVEKPDTEATEIHNKLKRLGDTGQQIKDKVFELTHPADDSKKMAESAGKAEKFSSQVLDSISNIQRTLNEALSTLGKFI